MEHFINRKRQRPKENYTSFKNKKRKYSNKYSGERNYESYKSSNDESYSYKRSDYNSYDRDTGHNNYYKNSLKNNLKRKVSDEKINSGYNKYNYQKKYNYYHSPSNSKSNYNKYTKSGQYGKNESNIWRKNRRESPYRGEPRYNDHYHESNYSRENDSYSRKNNSYSKNSKKSENSERYESRSRSSISNSYQKESGSGSSNSSSSSYSNKSEMHYPYTINEIISGKYRVQKHLSDGTFGRVLQCEEINTKKLVAMKVILPIKKYIFSAKIEAQLVKKVLDRDENKKSHCIKIYEYFTFSKGGKEYLAIIFELLGMSLYDFLKFNSYKGFTMTQVQSFAKQIFEGIAFLHSINIIHTDLKPENILLINTDYERITKYSEIPINISLKDESESANNSFVSTKSISRESKEKTLYKKLKNTTVKIIDFGSAVEGKDIGNGIINTRQYRSPEVILECYKWDHKSDIWSIACILIELYTGELLFQTHNNQEHLSLIEKVCGHYPNWMVNKTKSDELYNLFINCNRHRDDKVVDIRRCHKYNEVRKALLNQRTIPESICPRHHAFCKFIQYLLRIDPKDRPSAAEILKHEFFRTKFVD